MLEDTHRHSLVTALKLCAKLKDLRKGVSLHAVIIRIGLLEKDPFFGTGLISMYAKCGSFNQAREVLSELRVQTLSSWNALIAGYAQQQQAKEALNCLEEMQHCGITPDSITFACVLKACSFLKDIYEGQRIHAEISKTGLLQKEVMIGNAMIDMYAKCGMLASAHNVLDVLPVRNIISWSALIAGYAEHGQGEKALLCFEWMLKEGLAPNAVTFVCLLKACGSLGAAETGGKIHALIVREGLLKENVVVGNALMHMYSKCGLYDKAEEVFNALLVQNTETWGVHIGIYAQHGRNDQALKYFEQMQVEGYPLNAVTLVSIFQACGNVGAAKKGMGIHAKIVMDGSLFNDITVGTSLVSMYARCGFLVNARDAFDKLLVRNVVSWNALLTGYVQHGCAKEALKCFEQMPMERVCPDAVSFTCGLKACASIQDLNKGKEIHEEIARCGLFEADIVGNALVDMYGKFGLLRKSREVFDKLPAWTVVSWNALIGGYFQHRHFEEALNCFEWMQAEAFPPNEITFAYVLRACSNSGALEKGLEMHSRVIAEGLLEKHVSVGNALVDMYGNCGILENAHSVFNNLSIRDSASWSSLLAGYIQHGYPEEALRCYELMRYDALSLDCKTFCSVLRVCGSLGAPGKGQEVHAEAAKVLLLDHDKFVASAVVEMYTKCGLLCKAQEVFDHLAVRDVVLWNIIIAGYALIGNVENVCNLFKKMNEASIIPDSVTFTCVLTACGHTGLLIEGQLYFEVMASDYSIFPTLEHYNCIVDLFARAGQIYKAVAIILEIPLYNNLGLWSIILGACRACGNMELAKLAFKHVVQVDEMNAVAYISVSNINVFTGGGDVGKFGEWK